MYTTKKLYVNEKHTDDTGAKASGVSGYAVMLDGQIVTSTIGAEPYMKPHQALELYRQRLTAQKMADYYNGKVCEFPIGHMLALKAAFKTQESSNHPGYHCVADKTSEYLCKRLGLVTDWHEHNIMDTYKVAFCWRLQKWMVSA